MTLNDEPQVVAIAMRSKTPTADEACFCDDKKTLNVKNLHSSFGL